MNIKEWYKSKPHWLRGGVIAIIIYVLLTIIAIPLGGLSGHPVSIPLWFIPSFIGWFFFRVLFDDNTADWIGILVFIFSAGIYFLMGAFIRVVAETKWSRWSKAGIIIVGLYTGIFLFFILAFGEHAIDWFLQFVVLTIPIPIIVVIIDWIIKKIKSKKIGGHPPAFMFVNPLIFFIGGFIYSIGSF